MIRLLIAEDHAAMREKVIGALQNEYLVVGAVNGGQEMLEAACRVKPDAVIVDISMPSMNGIEAAHRLKEYDSEARIIFLTVHEEPAFLQAALAAGAIGYVIKARLVTDLPLAVREAMAGRLFISPPLRAGAL